MPTNKTGCFFTGMRWVLPVPSGVLVRNFAAKSKSKKPIFWGTRGLWASSSHCKPSPGKGMNFSFESIATDDLVVHIPVGAPHTGWCYPMSLSSGFYPELGSWDSPKTGVFLG